MALLARDTALVSRKDRLRGQLLRPDDAGYDAARRVWNAMIDRRPRLIVRCVGAEDVTAAVALAREHDLLLSVKGGGHNVAGNAVCDGGLMVDLTPMKGVHIDPSTMTARVEPGVLWEDFDAAAGAFGLATVGGVVGSTGVAGLTLGGGQGWLSGKHGLTIDNLRSVDVITADGRLLTASAEEHPDLFRAVEPHLGAGVYVNDLDRDDGSERVKRAYGANYERLLALKQRYDPTNLFRMNQNIPPTA